MVDVLLELMHKLGKIRGSAVLLHATGERHGLETKISTERGSAITT